MGQPPVRRTILALTPVKNGVKWIEGTVRSIAAQLELLGSDTELHYWVLDGESTDGTGAVVDRLAGELMGATAIGSRLMIRRISAKDESVYDALGKAFELALADARFCDETIVFYLNAGDYLFPGALSTVCEVTSSGQTRFLTGINAAMNEKGQLVSVQVPFRFRSRLAKCGAYGAWLPFIQQESTFWTLGLLRGLDHSRFRAFRRSGDYWLWLNLMERSPLIVVEALLGAFRFHPGQISEDRTRYWNELQADLRAPGLSDRLLLIWDRLIWSLPVRLKGRLAGTGFLKFEHTQGRWGQL